MRISDWSSDVCSSDLNVHRSLSRWGQLSQRDEYLDRRARPLSAPAQILQPVSPAAAYRLGCDRKPRTAQDLVDSGLPYFVPPRRADADLWRDSRTGDFRRLDFVWRRQTRLNGRKDKIIQPLGRGVSARRT